jgi:kanamycin kinase/aminoglycoside 3'-phosphotransferase-3
MLNLPDSIKRLIHDEAYAIDEVGMSDSTVVLFQDKVLKIQPTGEEAENEYHVMTWLQDKLPVPKILGLSAMKKDLSLNVKIPGEMSCVEPYMRDPEQLTAIWQKGCKCCGMWISAAVHTFGILIGSL